MSGRKSPGRGGLAPEEASSSTPVVEPLRLSTPLVAEDVNASTLLCTAGGRGERSKPAARNEKARAQGPAFLPLSTPDVLPTCGPCLPFPLAFGLAAVGTNARCAPVPSGILPPPSAPSVRSRSSAAVGHNLPAGESPPYLEATRQPPQLLLRLPKGAAGGIGCGACRGPHTLCQAARCALH